MSSGVICKQTAFIQNRNEWFDITSVILTNFVNFVCNFLWHLCKLHLYYKLLWTLSNLKTECRTNIISERNVGNKLFGLLELNFSVISWRLVYLLSPCFLWLFHTNTSQKKSISKQLVSLSTIFPHCWGLSQRLFVKRRNECWLS